MKLIRLGEPVKERPGLLLDNGKRIDVSQFSGNDFDYDEQFF